MKLMDFFVVNSGRRESECVWIYFCHNLALLLGGPSGGNELKYCPHYVLFHRRNISLSRQECSRCSGIDFYHNHFFLRKKEFQLTEKKNKLVSRKMMDRWLFAMEIVKFRKKVKTNWTRRCTR